MTERTDRRRPPTAGRRAWIAGAILAVALAAESNAVIVDGFVRTTGGAPIVNADLDWFNQDTDSEVDPTGDHTDATGYFQVIIPAGRYDITVLGPPGGSYAPVFLESVDLETDTTLPPTILPDGTLLTIHVQDEGGAPYVACTLRLIDTSTGDDVFLRDDDPDELGDLAVMVPVGIHDVIVTDDTGARAPEWRESYDTSVPGFETFVLRPGLTVTGRVVDEVGAGVFNVDVDVLDEDGVERFLSGDDSDFFGDWSVFLPAGVYEFRFKPAPASPFAPERVPDVAIGGSTDIGETVLRAALTVTGRLLGPGGLPLVDADVDVIDTATGLERYTPNDNTTASGTFSVVIPSGIYDFNLNPPAGAELAAAVRWDEVVSTSRSLGDITLSAGFVVSGTVTGDGSPLADVDMDFVDAVAGKHYPTPDDDTSVSGFYRVRVPGGVYDVSANPPAGSGFDSATELGVSITGDTTLNFALDRAVAVGDVPGLAGGVLSAAPNPFHRALVVTMDGVSAGTLDVFDARGRLVRSLPAGAGSILTWDGLDVRGVRVSPGVYLVRDRDSGASVRAVKVN